jgi:hypothetical protein
MFCHDHTVFRAKVEEIIRIHRDGRRFSGGARVSPAVPPLPFPPRGFLHAWEKKRGAGENRQKKVVLPLLLIQVDTYIRETQNMKYQPAKIDYERQKYYTSRHDRVIGNNNIFFRLLRPGFKR